MGIAANIEAVLRAALPPDLHSLVPALAQLLADVATGVIAPDAAQAHLADHPALTLLLRALAEQQLKLDDVDVIQRITITGGTIQGDIIGKQFVISLPPLSPAFHQLRAPASDFVGRTKESDLLVAALSKATESGAAVAICGVRGMAGIGKTELAYVVAQRLAPLFPDAQIVLELRGASTHPLPLEQALQHVILAFEPEAKLPDDLAQLQSRYRAKLNGKHVLVLADDAAGHEQIASLLPPPGCALLITSRHRFTLPGMVALDLAVLAPEEAAMLLLAICPRIGGHAGELAQLCGYLPLALRVSAGLLASDDTLDVAHYLLQLVDERDRLPHLRDPDTPSLSVEASLSLSYVALPAPTQQALCQASIFPASFDRAAAEAVIRVDGTPLGVLGTLRRRNLLEWHAAPERYDLHDLVRVFAAARLEDEGAVRLRHAKYYTAVVTVADAVFLQGGDRILTGLKLFDQERAHIDVGWKWARKIAQSPISVIDRDDIGVLLLVYALATDHIGEMRYAKCERVQQLKDALMIAQTWGLTQEQCWLLGNLGNAYHALGDARRARGCHKKVLAISRSINDRYAEGQALSNLGNAYYTLGDARRAEVYYKQWLSIARELGDRRGEEHALGNLGLASYALGNIRQALAYHEQVLAMSRDLGDRGGEGQALGNLGLTYCALGEARRASECCMQALHIAQKLGDRRGEGQALGNLGLAYAQLGEIPQAIEYHQQELLIAQEVGDRRGEGQALGNLGLAYCTLGEVERAQECCMQALSIAQEVGDRRGEGQALGNLGLIYTHLSEMSRAIEKYEQALRIAREVGDRRGEAFASWYLGLRLEEQGDLAQAVRLLQSHVDFLHGIGHPKTERYTAHLAEAQRRLSIGIV